MKRFIIFVLTLTLVMGLSACGSTSTTEPAPTIKPPVETVSESKPINDNTIDADIGDYHLTYLRHEVEMDYEDKPCLVVYFNFTNNNDEAKSFMWTISDKAFQNGIQLEPAIRLNSDDVSGNGMLDIKKGATLEVCTCYSLRDTDSEVEIEVEELMTFDDTGHDTMTIPLGM